ILFYCIEPGVVCRVIQAAEGRESELVAALAQHRAAGVVLEFVTGSLVAGVEAATAHPGQTCLEPSLDLIPGHGRRFADGEHQRRLSANPGTFDIVGPVALEEPLICSSVGVAEGHRNVGSKVL